MKAEDFVAAGIPIAANDPLATLEAEAALEWMHENTTLSLDTVDVATISALPACAKLFVMKYVETFNVRVGVSSQSIEGLSMSFTSNDKSTLVWQLANSLLGAYLKSQVRVIPARRRW